MMAPPPPVRNSCSPSLRDTPRWGGCSIGALAALAALAADETEIPMRSDVCFLGTRCASRDAAVEVFGGSSSSLGTVMSKGLRAVAGLSSTLAASSASPEPCAFRPLSVEELPSIRALVRADTRVFRRRSKARVVSAISASEAVLSVASRSRTRSSVRSRSRCRPVPPALVAAKRLASSSIAAFSKSYPRETWATHATHSSIPAARRTRAAELRNRLLDYL
jgi:hypothetical protein